jgi:hypothetical protein
MAIVDWLGRIVPAFAHPWLDRAACAHAKLCGFSRWATRIGLVGGFAWVAHHIRF